MLETPSRINTPRSALSIIIASEGSGTPRSSNMTMTPRTPRYSQKAQRFSIACQHFVVDYDQEMVVSTPPSAAVAPSEASGTDDSVETAPPVLSEIELHIMNRENRKPYLCWTIMCIDLILFIAMIGYNQGFERVSKNPLIGASEETVLLFGGKDCDRIQNGEYWRLIVANFLHVGVIHLLINMFMHLRLGIDLELEWGHKTWIGLYLFSGFYGNLTSCLFSATKEYTTAGASGSIFGLLGATVVDILINWVSLMEPKKMITIQMCTVIFNLAVGLLPGIDNWAHIGGLICGSSFGLLFLKFFTPTDKPGYDGAKINHRLRIAGVCLCLFFIVGGITISAQGVVFDCKACTALS